MTQAYGGQRTNLKDTDEESSIILARARAEDEIVATRTLSDQAMTLLKTGAKAALAPFNLTIARIQPNQACTLEWIAEAKKEGLEINEFIEKDQRKPALTELQRLVLPRISANSTVCEIGPGTGVYTRHLNKVITSGELHIVDNDPYAIEFLNEYLPHNPAVSFHLNSGTALPFETDGWMDLVFCASMFTGSNLTFIYRYMQEMSRVLRPGGHCVFDYFDISTDAGWNVLAKNMSRKNPIFAYNFHGTEVIDRIASQLDLQIIDRYPTIRGSVFVTAQKV